MFGLLERHTTGSKVRTKVVPNRTQDMLFEEIHRNVEPGAEIFTDAHRSYLGLSAEYVHQSVDHAEKYVDGNVHTNCMENLWSLLKRSIRGTYVSVEPFHLFRHLDEQAFRFNERQGKDGNRFSTVTGQVNGKRLTYKELTGKVDGDDKLPC